MDHRRQRPARRQPGPDLVDHRHHEDRPRRSGTPGPGDGPQRGRRLRRRRARRPWPPAPSPRATACGPSRSTSGSPSPASASGSRRCSSARPRGHAPHEAASSPERQATARRAASRGLRPDDLAATRRSAPSARPASSTTSTTGWPGACFPLLFAADGLSVGRIGVLAALYPAVWGVGQLVTGALSDRVGRKALIVGRHVAPGRRHRLRWRRRPRSRRGPSPPSCSASAPPWSTRRSSPPSATWPTRRWRASAVGVYRLWRDTGYVVGALLAGVVADLVGLRAAVWVVAVITALSGVVVAVRMYETHPRPEEGADDIDAERRAEGVLGPGGRGMGPPGGPLRRHERPLR